MLSVEDHSSSLEESYVVPEGVFVVPAGACVVRAESYIVPKGVLIVNARKHNASKRKTEAALKDKVAEFKRV